VTSSSGTAPLRPVAADAFLEIAAIMAVGILRLHVRSALSADAQLLEISPKSAPACLELPEETVLSVHTG